MRQFYSKSYYFWLITKIIFIIAGAINVVSILNMGGLRLLELTANVITIIYLIMMIINIFLEFTSGQQIKWIRYIVGVISVIIGLAIFILSLSLTVISIPLALIFSIWIILLGEFDLLLIEKSPSVEYD